MNYCKINRTADSHICGYCLQCFKKFTLPSLCVLNNLIVTEVPDVIKCLNMYEKILIQRAKAFQVVQKKQTVMKKNLPNHCKIDKIVERTFDLPLPIEETKKICPDTDPLNTDHEMYILVRGNPTKNKFIWEDYVNITKVWNALSWLKIHNPLYSKIILPSVPEQLLDTLKSMQLEYYENDSDKINVQSTSQKKNRT